MVAFHDADIFHARSLLEILGCSFDLQILNQGNCVAISQLIAIGINRYRSFFCFLDLCWIPLIGSLWADQERSIFVNIR